MRAKLQNVFLPDSLNRLVRKENGDIDLRGLSAFDSMPVIRFDVVPVETVAFDELAQNLLRQELLGRNPFLLAAQNVDKEIVGSAILRGIIQVFNRIFVLIAHPVISPRFRFRVCLWLTK